MFQHTVAVTKHCVNTYKEVNYVVFMYVFSVGSVVKLGLRTIFLNCQTLRISGVLVAGLKEFFCTFKSVAISRILFLSIS